MKREHPWNSRSVSAQHVRWFRNLIDLHRLTLTWIQELETEALSTSVQTKTGFLARLEGITPERTVQVLDSLMDDTLPEDVLGRLEQTLWKTQEEFLSKAFENCENSKRVELLKKLDELSWKAGNDAAQRRWKGKTPKANSTQLKDLYPLLEDTPLTHVPTGPSTLLLKRAIKNELSIEILNCPHSNRKHELANELCRFHNQWILGYLQSFRNSVRLDYAPADTDEGERCRQRWYITP